MQKRLTTTSGPHFGPTWSKELENDVSAECNNKYGKVVHIAVDANSEGEIVDQIKSRSFRCTCDGVCCKSPDLRPSGPRIGPEWVEEVAVEFEVKTECNNKCGKVYRRGRQFRWRDLREVWTLSKTYGEIFVKLDT